jgi:hypothetical protein
MYKVKCRMYASRQTSAPLLQLSFQVLAWRGPQTMSTVITVKASDTAQQCSIECANLTQCEKARHDRSLDTSLDPCHIPLPKPHVARSHAKVSSSFRVLPNTSDIGCACEPSLSDTQSSRYLSNSVRGHKHSRRASHTPSGSPARCKQHTSKCHLMNIASLSRSPISDLVFN